MDTKLFVVQDIEKDAPLLQEAADILKRGGLVAIPTETVYGLAADALNPEAVKKIFAAKGRPADNPLIVHIAEFEEIYGLASQVPESAKILAERFWPGPLTMIVPKGESIPDITSAGLPTVAIRMPSHPIAREIIRRSCPLAAPSANLSGSPSTTTAQHCIHDLGGRVDAIVDGGECRFGVESTVITLAGEKPRLLRPGAITLEELRDALGEVELDKAVLSQIDPGERVSSPGMKYKHYAPKAKVVIVDGDSESFLRFLNQQAGEGIFGLVFSGEEKQSNKPCVVYGENDEDITQAHRLFAALRELDERGAKLVYARCPRKEGVGLAVYNRLLRAAAFEEITL